MVLVYIEKIHTSVNVLKSALKLSLQLGKAFGIIYYTNDNETITDIRQQIDLIFDNPNVDNYFLEIKKNKILNFSSHIQHLDVSFLFIQLTENRSRRIQPFLNACRDLRIPYVIFNDNFKELEILKVIVPVTYLEEEVEKAQFASAFGRFCNAEIYLLPANDYGSKAAKNTDKIKELLDKFDIIYSIQKAESDSFKVEKEAVKMAEKINAGFTILTASRDYGLDDILFGPKELKLIRKSTVPILLINPRGDLYALCD